MKVFFWVAILLLFPLVTPAQDRSHDHAYDRRDNYGEPGSALTVFSENREPFFLMINGIKQNAYPQTRVRVEGLPQVTNDVQIIFDDNRTQAIQKRITFSDPVEGKAVNMVLKIARVQNGYPKLCFVKSTELMRDYRPEQGEYVMSYGRDGSQQGLVKASPPWPPREMDSKVFSDMKHSIAGVSFEETKLSTAKTVLSSNYISTAQVMEICRLFSFEDSKLDFAKFAYSKTVDPNNYFKVGNVFSFSSSKEALNDFLSGTNK
jgi:hypothetical protein